MKTEKSLSDLFNEALFLSWKLVYEDIAPDGTYLTPRKQIGTEKQESIVSSWADGLVHKYYNDISNNHCSLSQTINFDIGKFEDQVKSEIKIMKKLLKKLGEPKQLDFKEMQKRGYKGEWTGL